MTGRQIAGILVLALGVAAIAYGGFTYTEESHDVEIGELEIEVREQKRIPIPLWAGLAAAAVGVGLIITGRARSAP